MKVMYLDESGNHALDSIDPQYPIFVLGGVIVDRHYLRTTLEPRLQDLKRQFFGTPDIILHTADIVRAKNGFEILQHAGTRQHFYEFLNQLMRELDYTAVACAIKKQEHFARYGKDATDPYMFCLQVLVERFCLEIGDVEEGGIIYSEKRNPVLDHQLDLAWRQIQTTYMSQDVISKRIIDLVLRDKRLNLAGLQLADLVISPIGRAILGKRTHADWEIVKSKLRRKEETYEGYGLIVLPK